MFLIFTKSSFNLFKAFAALLVSSPYMPPRFSLALSTTENTSSFVNAPPKSFVDGSIKDDVERVLPASPLILLIFASNLLPILGKPLVTSSIVAVNTVGSRIAADIASSEGPRTEDVTFLAPPVTALLAVLPANAAAPLPNTSPPPSNAIFVGVSSPNSPKSFIPAPVAPVPIFKSSSPIDIPGFDCIIPSSLTPAFLISLSPIEVTAPLTLSPSS